MKRNLVKFNLKKDYSKFIIDVLKEDILVVLTKSLTRFLGFYKNTVFFHGSHTAPISFFHSREGFKNRMSGRDKMYLYDIRNMERQTFDLKPSTTETSSFSAEIPIKIDESKLSDEAKETLTDDYKFTMKIILKDSLASVTSKTPIKQEHIKAYRRFAVYSFDEATTKFLQLQPYSLFEMDLDGYKKSFNGDFNDLVGRLRSTKGKAIRHLTSTELSKLRLTQMKITLYSLAAKDLSPIPRPNTQKKILINGLSKVDILEKVPDSLNVETLPPVYQFSYDKSMQRFQLQVFPGYCLKLSKSLASKLGFVISHNGFILESKLIAEKFPNIKRIMQELYVYTNIIESVFVGDIKAPLLLVCPFKKDQDPAFIEFMNPSYKKLNRKTFQKIDVGIYDAYGDLLRFSGGQTVFNLHFRKVTN